MINIVHLTEAKKDLEGVNVRDGDAEPERNTKYLMDKLHSKINKET